MVCFFKKEAKQWQPGFFFVKCHCEWSTRKIVLRKEFKQNNLHKQYIVINGKIWTLKLHLLIKLKWESQRQKKRALKST